MVTGMEILPILSGIKTLVESIISLAAGLRGASSASAALLQQLTTFARVLQIVEQEFTTTLQLCGESNTCSVGLDVTMELLKSCLNDCSETCEQYHRMLAKISTSRVRSLRWKQAEAELKCLYSNMESRKSTLQTLLQSIRQVGENYRHSAALGSTRTSHHSECSRNPTNTQPPPYTASPSTIPARNNSDKTVDRVVFGVALGTVAAGAVTGAVGGAPGGPLLSIIGGVGGAVVTMMGIASFIKEADPPPRRTYIPPPLPLPENKWWFNQRQRNRPRYSQV